MTKNACTLSRCDHARDGPRVECADVEAEPRTEGGDLLHLLRIVRHDGTRPDGEQDVRHVIDGDIVGNAVDERGCRADLVEGSCVHDISSVVKVISHKKRGHAN